MRWSPKARQIRCTAEGDTSSAASERVDQWVAFLGVDSSVALTTCSTCSSVTVEDVRAAARRATRRAGRPENRGRHLATVTRGPGQIRRPPCWCPGLAGRCTARRPARTPTTGRLRRRRQRLERRASIYRAPAGPVVRPARPRESAAGEHAARPSRARSGPPARRRRAPAAPPAARTRGPPRSSRPAPRVRRRRRGGRAPS